MMRYYCGKCREIFNKINGEIGGIFWIYDLISCLSAAWPEAFGDFTP